jgi:TolB-like protein/DNA-binding winged helix-turn-helix (wHTH) protein/tetratricopeptide (TPR) repeat protein
MNVPRINLAETSDFDLGGLRVSPARRQVSMAGQCRELEPKVAQVLIALASASPSVVSRDRLVEQCWDGRIVGDDALNRCILALRHLAREYSPEPFAIETIPRVGYSLVAGPNGKPNNKSPLIQVLIALALLLAISAGTFFWERYDRAQGAPASIAILPFRNLSTGDASFAEGVSEEILDRLSREPQFRVAGRASSSQFGKDPDIQEVARKLKVDYMLEGSVRTQGDRVRVNAALIKAKDRSRLWSDSYDGTLTDVFAIQNAIGRAVATGLSRKLAFAAPDSRRTTNAEAYALYLNAQGLLRSGMVSGGSDAIAPLKRAIALDPGFAPAWSSLAEALLLKGRTGDNEGLIALIPQARSAARHALRLDPNDAEAHEILSTLLGTDSPEAIQVRWRAGKLRARTGEGQLALAGAFEASGRWEEAYAAMQRAHELDPSWSLPWRTMLDLKAVMGDRSGAEAAIRGGFADDPQLQSFGRARLAWFNGDFSEAARRWSELAKSESQWASPSKLSLQNALLMMNLSKDRPSRPPRPSVGQQRTTPARIWMTTAPSAAEWKRRNRSPAAELVYRDENVIAAKLMLNAGRASELVATYESPTGLLGLRQGQSVGTCFLQSAAIVAAAFRGVNRNAEADAILKQADARIRAAYRRGPVPLWFDDDAAGIWALQGKSEMAIAALERALRRGSTHSTRTDLPRIGDEPALGPLQSNPRFKAVLSKYSAHFNKERIETARALHLQR